MARNSGATKFASVNLNQSYGKQPQAAASPTALGLGTRSRLPGTTHGGMLLLTRPTRPQPAGQKSLKLSVPRPVNLPSLRREHSGNDPTVSLVGGSAASGWTKQQQSFEDISGDFVLQTNEAFADASVAGKPSGSSWALSQQSATLDGELRPQPQQTSAGRNGVYAPPGARTQHANATPYSSEVAPPTVAVEKAVLLRGEDFPTLQASIPPAPVQPQQRQKELQQRQRDKQRELKEEQEKLQQLTQKHSDEDAEKIQQSTAQLQPVLSLLPQAKHDELKKSQNEEKFFEEAVGRREKHPFREGGRSLPSGPAPLLRLNHVSNWADDERDISTDFKSQEVTIKPQEASFLDWIDRDPESKRLGHADQLGFRRRFHTETSTVNFGRNVDVRKGVTNEKENNQGWEPVRLKEGGYSQENTRDISFATERDFLKDNEFGGEGGYRRVSTFGREKVNGKSSGFGRDGGGFTRDEGFDKAHTFSRDEGVAREGSFGMDSAMSAIDNGVNRAMSLNKEVSYKANGPHTKGTIYDRDSQSQGGMNGYPNSRAMAFDREIYGGGMGSKGRDLRESYMGMNGQNKGPRLEREGVLNRDGYRDGFGGWWPACGREPRDGSLIFSRAGQNGDFNGGKAFNKFRNGGGGVFQEFGIRKAGRGDSPLDSGRGRSARSMLNSTDPYTRAFTEFVGLDYGATTLLGLEISDTKGLRRKKEDVKERNFRDLERESFEAELERVQKLLEEDRIRKIEERERAIELERKEQEDREHLAKEEEERQHRLEEEAREAAAKAEQEALEAVLKAEEVRRAREEEKKQIILDEERRKENARRKLLELEERISKREADNKQYQEEQLRQLHRGDHFHEANTPKEVEGSRLMDTMEEEVFKGKIYSVEQDDDDRAPLRSASSERPLLKFRPLDSVSSSHINSLDELNQQVEGLAVSLQSSDIRSSNNFESDQSRASSWKRGPFDNDAGTALTATRRPGSHGDSIDSRPSLPHDHSDRIRRFDDAEPPSGSSYSSSSFPGDKVFAENSIRKDRTGSSYERRKNLNDDMGSQIKYSNGHLRYSDMERGSEGTSESDRRNKDKTVNYHSWEGRPPSPLSPPYYYGTDLVENSPSRRLRQSLPKQPQVPPPPLQAYQKLPLQAYQKPFTKAIGYHVVDCSTQVYYETKKYGEQDMISREHHYLKSSEIEDLNHQPYNPQADMQSSPSEQEIDIHQSQKFPHSLAHQSESSNSLENDAHPSMLYSKLEPIAKPMVESHRIRSEEDSGEEGDEEMLEDSETAEYDEEEVSYEEKGEFEEEEEDDDDVEEEKVIDYQEDEDQETIDGELSSGEAENSKNKVPGIGMSEITADPFEATEVRNSATLSADVVTKEELFESIAIKEQSKFASLNDDLQLHHVQGEARLPDSIVGEVQQLGESSEVLMQPKLLQEPMTSPSSAFPPIKPAETMESDVHGSTTPHVQEQQPDWSTTPQPSMLSSSTPFQVPSLHAPIPSMQNHLDVPMTLQFGLLPSTSLLPASIPAIQIGSIQMPLPVHMHSQLSPQVKHLHPSHVSPFQFGHLGHPIALSQFLPSFSSQAQAVVPTSVQNDNVEQLAEHISSSKLDQYLHQSSQADKTMPEPVKYLQDASDKLTNGSEDENFVSQVDSKEQSSVVSGNKGNQVNENDFIKGTSQHVASPEATITSSIIRLHTIPRVNLEHRKNEGSSWAQLPGHLPTGTGNLTRGNELGIREREKDCHLHLESTGNHLTEARFEGAAYRARSNRHNSSRRSEFRPRETFVSDERPASDSRQLTRERFGTDYNRTRNTNEKAFQRDSFKGEGMHERKFCKDGGDNSRSGDIAYSQNSVGKIENAGSNEIAQKNLAKNSGAVSSQSGDGLLGKLGVLEDVPLQSGVVHVFEQPGIEIPGNGGDFIEVRSKRQMLNDRREQREKEIKAKSKAKEQVVRKQRSSAKQPPKGNVIGFKHSSLSVSEKKNLQGAKVDAVGSSSTRLAQSGTPTATLAASVAAVLATFNSQTPSLPPIISCLSETVLDKKNTFTNSGKTSSATGLPCSDGDISSSPISDILVQDNAMTATNAWGGTRSSQQVVSLTQIQLEEVLKPVRYDLPLQPQLSLGEHGIIGLEAGSSNMSVTVKERSSTSVTGPILPPLNGEKIQFGAVTSTYVSPISRPNTPSILGAVGSSVAFRSDAFTETNELRKKLKQVPGTEDDVSAFGMKGKRDLEDDRRNGGTLDSEAEAEAEAAASAVAVAAISNDDPVNNAKYGPPVSAILNSGSLIGSNLGGHASSSSSSGMMLGIPSARPVIAPAPKLEDSMTVALPADLSVETHSFSLGGLPPSGQGSSGLLLPSLPSPFPGLDFGGPMLGGHMFAFGAGSDVPTGLQGAASGSIHEQGAANLGLSIAGWQQHVGGSDSFYGAPHGFAGPFMSPAGAVPNLQAPHHMLVYTNPFSSIGQLGVSFMGPTYIQSGKQPDWTHTPVASSSSGFVGMSAGDLGGLSGGLAAQRNTPGIASPIQRLAPGPSVIPVTHPSIPFDLSREATYQIPTVEVSMQPQWSHVSAPHLQGMPMTGPLLGFPMQSKQAHGSLIPTGHLQHAEDASNCKHIVSSLKPVSSSSFQSINASAQFPDELGLGDSISTSSPPVSSYVGQQVSGKVAAGGAVSTGMSAVAEASKLHRGRRPRTAQGVGMQGTGEGIDGSHAGLQTSPENTVGQPASGGRSSPGHLQPQTQVSLVSPGQLSHHGFADEKLTSQISRAAGGMGGWSGQGIRKVGLSARPQPTERGISSEKSFVSSAKLKQVYVVKPSASYKRVGSNGGESSANMFVHEMSQTGISS
ncbi:hypothetical protein O6H91_20G029700 [Diphasiastrum complanatum]|uniref:Uncharacterized protein n=1 Tax=Diphasiastrum complanatum TaxID=34168 RepID=A0ACC2AQ12_DIPCM|nr:hypothetical protein O6H91_20G029700 [Diphasiastrum complanatum]